MTLSDWINITLCILSFILALISVITVVITLRQNHKMIENSTRPYIVIYARITNFQTPTYNLIIKNMGQSGAEITKLKCNVDLLEFSYSSKMTPFGHIEGTFLAPGQSIISNIDGIKLSEKNIDKLIFNISYDSELKSYEEQYKVNCVADREDNILGRACTEDKELKIISYTLQDLVEKLL